MAPSKTLLGSGTFGSVYSKLSKTRVVAVKVLSQHAVSRKGFFDRNQDDVFRENLLLTCHPNIVKILRVEQIKRNFAHGVVITMELMLSFDDLAGKLMGCHRLETIAKFVREVAEALSFLHSRDPPVVHRYLTPRNILFGFNSIRTELIAKVSDAGLAQALESAHSEEDFRIIPSRYNTQFMAPETMGYVCSPRIVYHPKMDIYSLGIILLTMVNGSPPDTQAYPLDSQTDAAWQAKLNKALTKLGENNPLRLIAERMNLKVMDFRDSMTRLESSLKEWIQVRKETVNKLENIGLANMIEKLKNVIKTENQANSVGTGMSVAGGAVMFGAVVASFFVGGAAVQAVQLARQSVADGNLLILDKGEQLGKQFATFVLVGMKIVGNYYSEVGRVATILSLPLDILSMHAALKRLETTGSPVTEWMQTLRETYVCAMEERDTRNAVISLIGTLLKWRIEAASKATNRYFEAL
ncbi:predicted protein [Nematostella vectensis]|uniref:Protein kinase domain-containing protein n=1 Tax=Nematostella vectensis TaxID=45351 RepID=A7SLK5_NEMVE|nr:predicted protein [Nematostella vectensis]|eukprot:XP_001627524.1 predicted protein [Nematostella vectensis]